MKNGIEDFYECLDITENKYSEIVKGSATLSYLENKWNERDSYLKKIGLSEEIMLGRKMIEIKGFTEEKWNEYFAILYRIVIVEIEETDIEGIENIEEIEKIEKKVRVKKLRSVDLELKKVFSDLESVKKTQSNLEKLYYYFKHGIAYDNSSTDREMYELKMALEQINIQRMKSCDKKLREEIYKSMQEKGRQLGLIIEYDKLQQ